MSAVYKGLYTGIYTDPPAAANAVAGDLLLLTVRGMPRFSTPSPPPGWQVCGYENDQGAYMNYVCWKIAVDNELALLIQNAPNTMTWALMVYEGATPPYIEYQPPHGRIIAPIQPGVYYQIYPLKAVGTGTLVWINMTDGPGYWGGAPAGYTMRVNYNPQTPTTAQSSINTFEKYMTNGQVPDDYTRARSLVNGTGLWHTAVFIHGDNPPNQSIPQYPAGNVSLDRSVPNRFGWNFSDPDVGETQSAFDWRARLTGAAVWDKTASGNTPNVYYDAPSGTFVEGNYEWQVRPYDNFGRPAPWSPSAFFVAGTVPPGPTIVDPINGSAMGASSGSLRWTFPTQKAFRVRKVADLNGSPDLNNILYDSQIIVDANLRSMTLTFPVNGRAEHLQVQVQDVNGLWSPWSSVRVTVSYTRPADPTTVLTSDSAQARMLIDITNPAPTGTQPRVTSWDVKRRMIGSTAFEYVAQTTSGNVIDWTLAAGIEYEYQVVLYGDNDTSNETAWISTATNLSPLPDPTNGVTPPTPNGGSVALYDVGLYDVNTYG